MVEVIPAIMPKTLDDLSSSVNKVKEFVSYVQVDVMDDIFVGNKSFPYSDWNNFQEILKKDIGLPSWQDINYEFDLMIKNPSQILDGLINLGAQRIIFHIESLSKEELRTLIDKCKVSDIEVGIAINNETPIENINDFASDINFVQLMGIARIGFQGEPFDERVIPRIKKIKENYPDLTISIDGGVNFDTAEDLLRAGANRLVSGSAIFESGDIEGAIKELSSFV